MQLFQNLLVSTTRPWALVRGQNTARLLIVALDANHNVLVNEIENDIFRLIKQLAPGDDIENANVEVTHADVRYKQKKSLYKVTSTLTGPIAIEDVIYFNPPGGIPNTVDTSKDIIFRRIRFGRTEVFAQSEALLATQVQNKKVQAKKGKLRMVESQPSDSQEASSGDMKVDHRYVRSGLTNGMISGLLLFSIHSKRTTSAGRLVKTVIIGLGAGLLPMCMRNYIPTLKIEVVESDPVVLNVAKEYFSFEEADGLKVHITDAMKFVKERAEGNNSSKIDVLIIEVDSSDSSSGLICPEAEFVEEPFLLAAKDSLSDKGLLIVKFITCYPGVRAAVYSNFEKVFSNLFCLHADKGFNELIFALKKDSPFIGEEELAQACEALQRSLEHNSGDWVKQALVDSKKIKQLRKS
ncbi:PREDICTED: methyltransferase-like protein 13 [Erythranthe guttata]|uniref:methyltransferase-like protein 13 n=1 Tax=Erythranthe guttata TaxID=4155 RepID=UPI00064D8F0D|nr:PREDICTED: methyltransferase-like protein 13 [Erythranthe guttata]XP_012842967.1 PREDICTED: methyltransferase-like protein 13 [Erythranthe guttata]|eukprot:XP_012842966.1 PREDICTED: methyltransferase-like protein 13 [Erythranthe guttata]